MSPRILIAVIASLLAGLLLGRIGPQADLRRANDRIDELQREMSTRTRPGAGGTLTGVKSMFKVSQQDLDAGAQARRAREIEAKNSNSVEAAAGTGTVTMASANTGTQKMDRAAMSNQVEKFKQAWAMRADLAKAKFKEREKLDEKQTQDFDVVVEAMNIRLGSTVDKWAAKIKQDGEMRPETGLRMMTEMGNDMVLTYDEMDRKMPDTWRKDAGQNFEMVNFVDPEVLTPLQDLDGIVNKQGQNRPPLGFRRNGPFAPPPENP